MIDIKETAAILDQAAKNANAIAQISTSQSFSEAEAYKIQALSISQRLERGEQLIGYKLGFTSRAKMIQMGVHDMIWGKLTDAMLLEEGGNLQIDQYVHPRAEPEICFLIKKEITRELNLLESKSYLEAIAPALEIIDSRYKNFKFSLEDVIADNCSSTGVVLGKWHSPNIDFSNLGMVLKVNQKPVHIGSSAAILGDPLRSLVAASRLITTFGETIPAGSIVMAGASTPAVFVEKGQYIQAEVQHLGTVSINIQ